MLQHSAIKRVIFYYIYANTVLAHQGNASFNACKYRLLRGDNNIELGKMVICPGNGFIAKLFNCQMIGERQYNNVTIWQLNLRSYIFLPIFQCFSYFCLYGNYRQCI